MIIKSIHQLIEGRPLIAIRPEASVREACEMLDKHNVGALAVVANGRLTGILSERDVIRRCLSRGVPVDDTPVSDVMTADPVTVRCTESLAASLNRMIDGGFRHLPVVESGGDVLGMISMRDIPTEYRLMVERSRDLSEEAGAA